MRTPTELRKLRRPAIGVLALCSLLVVVGIIGLAQAADADQWRVVTEGRAAVSTDVGVARYCQAVDADGSACDRQVAHYLKDLAAFEAELIRDEPYGAALQHPAAAPGVAAGMMASAPGLAFIAIMAALHVGGEWASGTARILLSGRVAPARYLLHKLVSVLVGAVGLLLIWSVALALLSPLLRGVYGVAPLSPDFEPAVYSATALARSTVVISGFVTVGVVAAVCVRTMLGALSAVGVFALTATIAGGWRSSVRESPSFWVSSVMRFDPAGSQRDHIWPSSFPVGATRDPVPLSPVLGLAALVGLTLCLVLVGWIVLRRREVS